MTILHLALAVLASGSERPATERVDRRLVALRVVRDLDRDGVQDLAVRTWSPSGAGIAAISAAQGSVLWTARAPDGVADWSAEPMQGALAPLGDHDRDGVGEIAALWRRVDASTEPRGAVLAWHTGRDGSVLRAVELPRAPGGIDATTLAAPGDLDGDLLPDLVALAPARELYAGRIAAISSATGDELWSATTSARGDASGTSIAVVRDLDGDATVDVALAAGGGIEVLSGRDGRIVKRVDFGEPAEGEPAWIASGSLAVVGDVDGDAILDVVAAMAPGIGHATSAAVVSLGAASVLARRELPVWSKELGTACLRAAGDFDGDRRIDLVCADPGWNLPDAERSGGVDVGSVRVLSGADGSELRAWHGGLQMARVGALTAFAGDVDRDGCGDVWLSAVDTAARPHEVLGLASGRTGTFLRWIDLGRMDAATSRP